MTNTFGLRCPPCGNTDLLDIGVRVCITLDGDKVRHPYEHGKFAYSPFDGWQWVGTDRAYCPQCDHIGTVDAFEGGQTMTTAPEPKWITVTASLCVSETTVWRWIRAKQVNSKLVVGRHLIEVLSVHRFFADQD